MKWRCAALAIVCAVVPAAPAQKAKRAPAATPAKPAQAAGFPLASVSVEGNRLYSAEQILRAAGLRIGQAMETKDFEAARQRLLDSQMFASVGFSFAPNAANTGYAGKIQVLEVEPVYPFRFEDLPAEETVLTSLLQSRNPLLGARIPATKEMLAKFAREIDEYLKPRGFDAGVQGKVAADAPGELTIVFRPAVDRPVVAEVKFTGNEVIETPRLADALAGVAVGVPYTEKAMRQLLESSLRPLYEARGRLRVKFGAVTTAPAAKVNGLIVTTAIEEGPSYTIGEIQFAGAPFDEDWMKTGGFRVKETANFDQLHEAEKRVVARLKREGYLRAASALERRIDDGAKRVDLTVRMDPGPQYRFGKLTIVGLDIVAEPEIRKLWGLAPGKPMDAEFPDYFLKRIKEDRVLERLKDTRSELKLDEKERSADVILYFR